MTTFEKKTREELVFQLTVGNAHMPFEKIIEDFPVAHYNDVFPNGEYSFWFVLEHIRRVQADILNFIVNPNYVELEFPKDYWPEVGQKATKKEWDKTVKEFLKDRQTLKEMIEDPKTDLFKKIPWGTGQTFIREILVIVDHNSYELGEFAIMRQVMGVWGKYH